MSKLEKEGYVEVQKEFIGKKLHSMVMLTPEGREAFRLYKQSMQQILGDQAVLA